MSVIVPVAVPFMRTLAPMYRFLLRIDDRPGNLFRLCQEQGDVLVGYTKRNISFAAEQVPQDLVQALIGLLDGDPFRFVDIEVL